MLKQFYYKRNRIQQLKGFYYTVQTGNISNAARKLGLSQSAITLRIQSLERDLNTKLFERSGKKIQITKEGEMFFSQAAAHMQGIDGLFERFSDFLKNENSKLVTIGANHVSISYILPPYLKILKDDNKDVALKIQNISKEEGVSRLLDGKIDMFVYPMQKHEISAEFDFIPVVNYQPILLIRKDHPLAKKKKILMSDIKEYELVRIDPKFITLPAFEEIIRSHDLKTSVEFEMSDWEILKKFVKAKIGVAIISNIVLEGEEHGDLMGIPLLNYFPEMTYGILVKKGKIFTGATKKLFDLLTSRTILKAQSKH